MYADPPPEAKALLGMSDTQIFRIVKAIYGLLHAPKRWFESLSRFLVEEGWTVHSLDQCWLKLVSKQGDIIGFLGLHVDDVITGCAGELFQEKVRRLRS